MDTGLAGDAVALSLVLFAVSVVGVLSVLVSPHGYAWLLGAITTSVRPHGFST